VTPDAFGRSITAVLAGTFTLRLSTGLTGTMLATYLAEFQQHGGPDITALELGVLSALYFASELVLSPAFGVLSDHLGSHRVMQWGPFFGAVAVVMTAVSTHSLLVGALGGLGILFWLGATRLLEGAAAGASIPSILGYIAAASSDDEALRGRVVSRFEAATLAGLGLGVVAGPALFGAIGPIAFILNAGIYAISFAVYRWGVAELPAKARPDRDEAGAQSSRFDIGAYLTLLRSRVVWLLAPTWIALNAVIGSWTSQSVYQLVRPVSKGSRQFTDQVLSGGIDPTLVSAGAAVGLLVFLGGLLFWGNRFKRYRRTTIIAFGVGGGFAMLGGIAGVNHGQSFGWPVLALLVILLLAGLFVLAGGTPAALGLLADMTEAHPENRGAVMGLYSVFLGVGQIVGSLSAGIAADRLGFDGLILVSVLLLGVAVIPLRQLRGSEHLVDARPEASQA